jgi:leucyl/phenylalanyl-tRNA--protein transferase
VAREPSPTSWRLEAPPDDHADDLWAVGADLEPGTLLAAYRLGLFPMPLRGTLGWFSPSRRAIVPLEPFRPSRSLRRARRRYEIRVDVCFRAVVSGCARPGERESWIDDDVTAAYGALHELGWAHSVETYRDGELVGGLYGVRIAGLFAGESMFHRETDASKVALVHLVEWLAADGASLLDVQWTTDHLRSLGAIDVERDDYLAMLHEALAGSARDTRVAQARPGAD